MPRAKRPTKPDAKRAIPRAKSLDEEAEVTALDMAVLNEFIHDAERSDTLRLAALKVKVGREAALLKERIAEKTTGMNIVVNTLSEDDPDGEE
jgi:hypothetical protein